MTELETAVLCPSHRYGWRWRQSCLKEGVFSDGRGVISDLELMTVCMCHIIFSFPSQLLSSTMSPGWNLPC